MMLSRPTFLIFTILVCLMAGQTGLIAGQSRTRVEILPQDNLQLGDIMQIAITSPIDGFLTLIDVDKKGTTTLLFPGICNKPDLKLRAGSRLTMPTTDYGCEFPATEPGQGEIIAIITRQKTTIDQLVNSAKTPCGTSFRGIRIIGADDKPATARPDEQQPAADGLSQQVKCLKTIWNSTDPDWFLGTVEYTIGNPK